MEDLQLRTEAQEDPRGFLARLERAGGVILDEVQRAPDLFSYLQGALGERRLGPVVLTGSQQWSGIVSGGRVRPLSLSRM